MLNYIIVKIRGQLVSTRVVIFRGEGRGATRRDYHLIKIQKHRLTGRSEKSDIGRVGMRLYSHCIHIIIICTSVGRWEILIESSVFWPVYRCIYYIYIHYSMYIYTKTTNDLHKSRPARRFFVVFILYHLGTIVVIARYSSGLPISEGSTYRNMTYSVFGCFSRLLLTRRKFVVFGRKNATFRFI